MSDHHELPISHLQRRKIEGRALIPLIQTLRDRLGEDAARELVDTTIRRLAAEDGAKWAEAYGQDTSALKQLAEELWAGGGGLDIEVLEKSDQHVDFNVTRCRYAEFYQELGLAELGYQLQCSRDHAMLAGFNPAMELSRTQTLMEGGSCCDFRFRQKTAIT